MRGSHLLCLGFFLAFLVLAIGADAPWTYRAIEALSLGGARDLVERPWALLTYPVVLRDPLEAVLVAGLLLLAGAPVEERIGIRRFLALFAVSAGLVGLGHVALVEAGMTQGLILSGAVGPACSLLTAYLFVCGDERRGGLPFPALYLVLASALGLLVLTIHHYAWTDAKERIEHKESLAYDSEARTPDERLDDLAAAGRIRRLRTDEVGHLLGLACGAAALAAVASAAHYQARLRVFREIRGLQQEVEARARVEQLLEKISRHGLASLSRAEQRFLRYASRYYRGGVVPAADR